MLRADMVLAYLRDLLEKMTGERPQPDADGDLPITYGGARFYVRVLDGMDPVVQVFSVAVANLAGSAELFAALNDINSRLGFARAFHVAEQVLFETEIWGSDINPANFEHACRNVANATDDFGTRLVKTFGGEPRFEVQKSADYPAGLGSGPRIGFTAVLPPTDT